MNPTQTTYETLNKAYQFFNKELFEGKLPECLITMQRRGRARGYFCAEMFESRTDQKFHVHEIAMNPKHFSGRSDEDIISTLVHEMAHVWQQEFGNPPRRNYHDREWGGKMEDIGLIPSNTGEIDGKKTGQSMSHYIDPNGRYAQLIKEFLAQNPPLQFQDRPIAEAAKAKKKNKTKYSCAECGANAWAKPNANLMCGDCEKTMDEVES